MGGEKTTVWMSKETVERLQGRMPYESTTYEEVVIDLLEETKGE